MDSDVGALRVDRLVLIIYVSILNCLYVRCSL